MSDRPAWDEAAAERLIGATVLIGITYDEPAGARLEQMFGTVMLAEGITGITVRLEGSRSGEIYKLPPHLDAFYPAEPGVYTLRGTGELVTDPDYLATWDVTPRRQ